LTHHPQSFRRIISALPETREQSPVLPKRGSIIHNGQDFSRKNEQKPNLINGFPF
jgi:hypothetical protein